MRNTFTRTFARPRALALAGVVAALSLTFAPGALSARRGVTGTAPAAKPPAAATLEECVTAEQQPERSATFSGEMSTLPGTARMEMRIDVLERDPREAQFHTVSAPGLGVWRSAAPGVKTFRYLKQVTNLAAPAFYRAAVRFRWLNSHGRVIHWDELRTQRCLQTVTVKEEPPAGGAGTGA